MRTSWKAAVVPAAIILLLLFSIAGPIIIAAQASEARQFANETGPFILKATRIDTTNARLNLSDLTHPIFEFATATIQGLQILAPGPTGYTLTITASSQSSATDVAIKTTLGYETETALASFTNKLDLITLALGGTVSQLSMTNVSLTIDTYLKNGTLTLGQPLITLQSGSLGSSAASTQSLSSVVNSLEATATGSVIATTTATVTATTTATATATSTSESSATPTAKATSSSKSSATPTAEATSSSSSTSESSATPTAEATSSSSSSDSSEATPTATSTSSCNLLCKIKKVL